MNERRLGTGNVSLVLRLRANILCIYFLKERRSHTKIGNFKSLKFNESKVIQRCLYSGRQRYSSSQWSKCCGPRESSTILPTVMTNIVAHKSTDNDLVFTITPKKVFISGDDQIYDTKKVQGLSITFSQYDRFISQKERS